jgi:hypothetical protein
MECTTHLGLHSQAIRLFDNIIDDAYGHVLTGLSPSVVSCSKELHKHVHGRHDASINYNSDNHDDRQILKLS